MRDFCETCAGCGKIANDEDGTPWEWMRDLPYAQIAIRLGTVKPITCPDCDGTGAAGFMYN